MAIRFLIDPEDSGFGDFIPEELWDKLFINFFSEYKFVGFCGIRQPTDLGCHEEEFNLTPLKMVKILTKWPEKYGGDKDVDEFFLFATSKYFMSLFYSLPFSAWSFSNFPFDFIVLFKNENSVDDLVYIDASESQFTIFSKNGEIPDGIKIADPDYVDHCQVYDDMYAQLL